jgi:hypothetical protein
MNPLVAKLLNIMKLQGKTAVFCCKEAGLGEQFIYDIKRKGVTPNLNNFEALLNVLGYELKIVRKD